jgi:ParB/RepB/Spo0J family partition protein
MRHDVQNVNLPLVALPKKFVTVPPLPQMIESISAHGVLQPIVVKRIGPGEFKVIGGKRRVQAARIAGLKFIPSRVYGDNWPEADIVSLIMNEQRASNPLAELECVEALIDQGESEDSIRRATGMSLKKIKSLVQLRNLNREIRIAFEEGKLKMSVAMQVSCLPESQQKKLLAVLRTAGVIRLRDVKDIKQEKESVVKLPIELVKSSWRAVAQERLRDLRSSIEGEAPPAFLRLVDRVLAEVGAR